jgi:hypothetical protein
VAYLQPGHYWGTDASGALMARGRAVELADPGRLPPENLIEDADFAFPGVPGAIDFAMAFAVFTHLPPGCLAPALCTIRARFPALRALLLTVFLAPEGHCGPLRQPDGVVTHADRPPYHRPLADVLGDQTGAGFAAALRDDRLPRGQRLIRAVPSAGP